MLRSLPIRLLLTILLLNVIIVLAAYESPKRRHRPSDLRSADTNYRYSWFTRDVSDQDDDHQEQEQEQQQYYRTKMLLAALKHRHSNGNGIRKIVPDSNKND